jgi:cytosine deaminase
VPELLKAGINVGFGHDCVMDPWYAMGSGDMLEVGGMAIHVAQMGSIEDRLRVFDILTNGNATAMGLEDYGLEKGKKADLVVLQARDPVEALRLRANRLAVIKGGKVIARAERRVSALALPGRPGSVDGALYAPAVKIAG